MRNFFQSNLLKLARTGFALVPGVDSSSEEAYPG